MVTVRLGRREAVSQVGLQRGQVIDRGLSGSSAGEALHPNFAHRMLIDGVSRTSYVSERVGHRRARSCATAVVSGASDGRS